MLAIQTTRGQLLPLAIEHADQLFELIHNSRESLHRWLPWLERIHSSHDTKVFIDEIVREKGPQFAIEIDGHLCGSVGFYLMDNKKHFATLGYWLGQEYVGQGIMSDAVKHLCHYGYDQLNLRRIEIRCAEDNLPSRNLPERMGFYYEGKISKAEWLGDQYVDHACYTLLKSEFYGLYGDEFSNLEWQKLSG